MGEEKGGEERTGRGRGAERPSGRGRRREQEGKAEEGGGRANLPKTPWPRDL